MKYTNQYGIELTINEKSDHLWFGEMTRFHNDKYTEFVVKQGKHLLGDGFETFEDAKAYAETIEF